MMGARSCRRAVGALLLVLSLLGCAAPTAVPAEPSGRAGPAQAADKPAAAQAALPTPAPVALERVVFTTSDPGLAFAPLYVAVGKGFFREEGLEVDVQVARTDVSLAALANNQDVDYTAALGTVVRGAVSGLPVRAVGIWYEKTAFYLMARPEIQTLADLKGKVVGVSSFNATTDVVLREVLRGAGVDPESDVSIIQVGTGTSRLAAVSQGTVVASLFTPPDHIVAEQHGLRRVPSPAEALPVAFTGVSVSEKKLQENRPQVERMLRATLRTLQFMHSQPREASDLIAAATDVDPELSYEAYQSVIGTLSVDGWAAPEALRRLLEQSTAPGAAPPPDDAIYDPGPLKAAQQALGIAGRP
jgi:ABC-type nitrate/sulfonate/bicarbonate transport system substrate-binding protein